MGRLGGNAVILHLVRHARPVVAPDRAPASWTLADDTRAEIDRLRHSGVLPADALWLSSPEPKALATARALTDRPVHAVDALREMHRPPGLLPDERFRAAVTTSLLVPDRSAHPGWETATATTRRTLAALDAYAAAADDRDVVLVGHGTAWTLLVAALTDTKPDVAAWERLTMPDHCAISTSRTSRSPALILHPWGSWPS